MLSTHGGIRAPDGSPIALGYHTGHWEVGLLVEEAAAVFKAAGAIPFAAACTDPCDGRSQGTTAMFDSLPFRNDAATVFRRLIRSLPTRRGVLGVATCDKGLPAMMMALAGQHRSAVCPGPRRRDFAGGRGRRCRTHPDDRRAVFARRADAGGRGGARLSRVRLTRRRLSVSRNCRDRAGGRRGAWPVARPHRARPFRSADLARHGAPLGTGADATRGGRHDRASHSHRRLDSQCDGDPRRVRRVHEPAPAPAGDRARRRPPPPHGAGVGRREPTGLRAWSTRCRTGRAIIRRSRCSSPAVSPR